jgi:phosphatidylglycerophosphate synthase
MIDRMLRTPKEQLLQPMAHRPFRAIHPIAITLLALGVGLGAAVAAWQQIFWLALLLWLLNRLLDGLDGTVARLTDKQSDLGAYLDIVCDTLVYAAIPLGLAFGAGTTAAYVSVGLLVASFHLNTASWMYLAALLEKRKHGATEQQEMTSVTMPSGLIEGGETIVFFCLFLLFPQAMVPLFLLMALLTLATAAQQWRWAAIHL